MRILIDKKCDISRYTWWQNVHQMSAIPWWLYWIKSFANSLVNLFILVLTARKGTSPDGLGVWFVFRVDEVPSSILGQDQCFTLFYFYNEATRHIRAEEYPFVLYTFIKNGLLLNFQLRSIRSCKISVPTIKGENRVKFRIRLISFHTNGTKFIIKWCIILMRNVRIPDSKISYIYFQFKCIPKNSKTCTWRLHNQFLNVQNIS